MPLSDPELWQRLTLFSLDENGAAWPFSSRLAHENNWTKDFATSSIQEYKKFMYLACVSREPLTPSDAVDEVWHLHLAYTKDYWNGLCQGVLHRDLHHGPTRGGGEEDRKFRSSYAKTLSLYRAEFEKSPPADIWPGPDERFLKPRFMKRVDTRTNWIVPKPELGSRAAMAFAVLFVLAVGLAGCVTFDDLTSDSIIPMLVFLAVFVIIIVSGMKESRKKRNQSSDGSIGFHVGASDGKGGDADGGAGCGSGCGGGGD
jgi:hypothetical protein